MIHSKQADRRSSENTADPAEKTWEGSHRLSLAV